MLEVIVPATSANIGPGYDCLGIALNLYNKFYFEEIDKGFVIEEKETEYINEDNLVYKSMLYFYEKVKPQRIPQGIKIKIVDEIPIWRLLRKDSNVLKGCEAKPQSKVKRFGSSRKRLSISDAPLLRHLSNHLPTSRILLARLAESCARHKFHIYSRVPFPLRERFAP